ncbi:MAG: hypothetical protein J5770_05740 [Bacteroidaceae bacterium]|nr:hypothetical protein [Bacteroidaceae bacterium]
MSISNASTSGLRTAIEQAVNHFVQDDDFLVVTDFHLHLDADTGEVAIADDTEMTISSAIVEEWVDLDGDEDMEAMARELKSILSAMSAEGAFEHVSVSKPFSFVLEDDNQETIDELFYVDEDLIILSDDLLKDMDKDLDDFFEKLMKE